MLEDDATKAQRKKAERELQEGLAPYRPFVPLIPRQMVSHTLTIVGLKNIYATDSKLESTSLVLLWRGPVRRAAHAFWSVRFDRGRLQLRVVSTTARRDGGRVRYVEARGGGEEP